jgi:hypothetical protein
MPGAARLAVRFGSIQRAIESPRPNPVAARSSTRVRGDFVQWLAALGCIMLFFLGLPLDDMQNALIG